MQKSNQGIYGAIATGYRSSFFSMRSLLIVAFLMSLFYVALTSSSASTLTTVPTKMNFQGRLADTAGNVKANGTYNMRLKLYTVDTGGSAVWSEDRLVSATQGVTVTNGTFSIQLGSVTSLPASLFASGALYFEVELPTPATATSASPVWTEGPMTPRNQMATSAYAYNAETLDGIDSTAFAQVGQSNTFTSAQTVNVSSASAFDIQDGSSVSVLKVDTSASVVSIGTADATGTILVLDTKNTAGDPTGVAGAMYYNSFLGKLRCYQNGAWTDCVGAGIVNGTSQQAGANFNIDGTGTASILQAGTFDTAVAGVLNIGTTNATSVSIAKDTAIAAGKALTIVGGNTASRPLTPAEGMLYYEQTTDQMLVYANGKWQGDRSSSTKIVAASNSTQAAKDAADYVATGTGDQAQINAALTAAAGGTVYLMEGTYTANATIVVPTDTILSGSGRNTLIRLADIDVSENLIEDSSSGKITIRDLRIDGQKSLNTAGTQIGIYLNGLGINTAGAYVDNVEVHNFRNAGIQVYDSDNSRFNNIWVDSNDVGIYVYAFGNHSEFTKITAEQNVSHGIHFSNGANNTLRDSVSRLNGGYGVYLGDSNNVIENNTIISNTAGGIYNDGANTSISDNDIRSNTGFGINSGNFTNDAQVNGNNIASNGGGGVYLRLGSSGWSFTSNTIISNTGNGIEANRANENIQITGNMIRANTVHGIYMSGYIYQYISGETITGNTIRDNASNGVLLNSVNNSNVSSNSFINNGGATANNAIVFSSAYNANITVSSNTITDTSCTTTCNAITITGRDNYISDNTIGDATLVGINGTLTYGVGQISDSGINTIYANQRDGNGNLLNRGGGGLSVNTTAITSSLTLQGGFSNTQLPVPAQPTVATVGTAGTTTYGYRVTALDGTGETLPSAERTIATGNAVLNSTNYNQITWEQVSGAVQYKVYRTTSAGTPATTGLIATITGASNVFFNDTGIAGGAAVPTTNTTGGVTIAGILQGSSATLTTLYASTVDTFSAGTLNIGGANATGINIATNNIGHSVNVATGTGNQVVTIGSTSGTSSLNLQGSNSIGFITSNGSAALRFGPNEGLFFGAGAGAGGTGGYNTGIGHLTFTNNTTGEKNASLGYRAMAGNTTGGANVAVGHEALLGNSSGSNNVAIGWYASSNSTGFGNVAIGSLAGSSNISGNNNTFLGQGAGSGATLSNLQQATAIGAGAQVQQNNSIVLGSVDDGTKVGIGITAPNNLLSVSPVNLNSWAGGYTATQSSTTVTASSSIFSTANVGEILVWADGTANTITGYTNGTTVTVANAGTYATATNFRTHKVGLQVATSGNVGIGTINPGANLDIKTGVNTTTAFRIQDSSGVNLLVADTVNTKVTVRSLEVTYNLTVNGHIISGGSTPTIATEAGACTSPASPTVVGTDTAGYITVQVGSNCSVQGADEELATITFSTAFGSTPYISLTPADVNTVNMPTYVPRGTANTTSFKINYGNTLPTDSGTYHWYYHVIQ